MGGSSSRRCIATASCASFRRAAGSACDGYLIEEGSFDQVSSVYENTLLHLPDDGERKEYPYSIRCYTATELVEMLREAGFEDMDCYGGFDGEELTFETRLVLLAA